jgi:hypothetical protein
MAEGRCIDGKGQMFDSEKRHEIDKPHAFGTQQAIGGDMADLHIGAGAMAPWEEDQIRPMLLALATACAIDTESSLSRATFR